MKYVVILLLFVSSTIHAENYRAQITKFFALYEQGKSAEAVDSIFSTMPEQFRPQGSIKDIKEKLAVTEGLVGNYNGKILIHEHNVQDIFIHVTYLALYDRQPIRMEFQFYKPKDKWNMYSYSFDANFDEDVKFAARKNIAEDAK